MRLPLSRTLLTCFAALGVGCASDNGTGPGSGLPNVDLTFDVCPDFIDWVAFKNEGAPWQRVTAGSNGKATIHATEKISIAFSFQFFGSRSTQVLNATADELRTGSVVACPTDLVGGRSLKGTVAANLADGAEAWISGAAASDFVDASKLDWTLDKLPNVGPVDLIASLDDEPTLFSRGAGRVIVRRGLTPSASGVTVAPLDFTSSEARAPDTTFAALIDGLPEASTVEWGTQVITATGTIHELFSETAQVPAVYPRGVSLAALSLPASVRVSTDVHSLTVTISNSTGTYDLLSLYTQPTRRRDIDFGPMVSAPTIDQLATSPYLRLRARVPAQPTDYPLALAGSFYQSTGLTTLKVVGVTTTARFMGGVPSTWELSIPDFTSSSGFDAAWGLTPGAAYEWDVSGFSGDLAALLRTEPSAPATLVSATRSSAPAPVLATGLVRTHMRTSAWWDSGLLSATLRRHHAVAAAAGTLRGR